MNDFLSAIGLVFIIEGLVLFLASKRLLKILELLKNFSEKKTRLVGCISIIIGILLLWIIRK